MSQLSNYALGSALGKDERKWKLKQLITQKKCLTVSACMKQMNLSRKTILTYLKELDLGIYDDETKDFTPITTSGTKVYPF